MSTFTAGQVLTAAELNALLALGKVKKVTASGNVTSTDLPAGQAVIILGWSGGGGSGGCAATTAATNVAAAAGGSSGAFGLAVATFTTITFPFVVTIGAGGTLGAAGNNAGGTGGNTTVVDSAGSPVTYLSLTGGGGGAGSAVTTTNYQLTASANAAGGVTVATFGIAGASGGYGYSIAGTGSCIGGHGAAAPWGGGLVPAPISNGTARSPLAGIVPGGGACGGSNTGTASAQGGAVGGRGEVWFICV